MTPVSYSVLSASDLNASAFVKVTVVQTFAVKQAQQAAGHDAPHGTLFHDHCRSPMKFDCYRGLDRRGPRLFLNHSMN
jgi:hypothetical protein